jgi:hypothetical protein
VASVLRDGPQTSLTLLAVDAGPGMSDVAACLRDGYSTSGTPGTGLGAVIRLASAFDVHSTARGTVVFARFDRGGTPPVRPALDVGAVSVPMPGQEACGDAWAVVAGRPRSAALVVDGLGHGILAAEAAAAAVAAFRRHASAPPAEILTRIDEALRHTRGAAATVLTLDLERRIVLVAGIGNVAGTVIGAAGTRSVVSHHGVLGHSVRRVQEFQYPWPEHGIAVLQSDGLGTRWTLDAYPGLALRHPMVVAGTLHRDFRRGTDDATVLVLREAA